MNISEAGLSLVKSFEQCRLTAYMPTAHDVPTIGWGHTNGVKMGDVWTQEQADARLKEDLADAEKCVNSAVSVPLNQFEFDACVSLAFNIGCHAFSGSTLLRLLNDSDFDGACAQFSRWDKQAGQVLAGLTRRRAAEAELFERTA